MASPLLRGVTPGHASTRDPEAERLVARILGDPLRARELLRGHGLRELAESDAGELVHGFGLDPELAGRLAASFSLARRIARAPVPTGTALTSAARVHDLLAPSLGLAQRETFVALLLDGKHRLRRSVRVSEGTLTTSLVHPREVYRPAIRNAAAALIVAHNHPSGDPEPSQEDLEVTRRLVRVGELVGIPLLDHVVLGASEHVSLRDRMPELGERPRGARPARVGGAAWDRSS